MEPALRAKIFKNDLNRLSLKLIDMHELQYSRKIQNLADPLVRWLDYRLRYIDPLPRTVLFSKQLLEKNPTPNIADELKVLEIKFRDGVDVNPHQTKQIKTGDTSGKQRSNRTDLLWADWGIHHLHLNSAIHKGDWFTERSNYLLFCKIFDNFVLFIDIFPHEQNELFSNQHLFEIIIDNWPQAVNHFKFNGALTGTRSSNSEIHQLRKGGVNATLLINDSVYYSPGFGLTTACIPTKITLNRIKILRCIESIANFVNDKNSVFSIEMGKCNIHEPVYNLCISPRGLGIYEKNSNITFLFPALTQSNRQDIFATVSNLFFPAWTYNEVSDVI